MGNVTIPVFDALETGKLGMDNLTPSIRELRAMQYDLSKIGVQVEAKTFARERISALPSYTLGGDGVTIGKTFELAFSLAI